MVINVEVIIQGLYYLWLYNTVSLSYVMYGPAVKCLDALLSLLHL